MLSIIKKVAQSIRAVCTRCLTALYTLGKLTRQHPSLCFILDSYQRKSRLLLDQVGRNSMATGLYKNIANKKRRIARGSGETMRKVGSKGAPTAKAFRQAKKTAKKK